MEIPKPHSEMASSQDVDSCQQNAYVSTFLQTYLNFCHIVIWGVQNGNGMITSHGRLVFVSCCAVNFIQRMITAYYDAI
jgi:hypothetical protein